MSENFYRHFADAFAEAADRLIGEVAQPELQELTELLSQYKSKSAPLPTSNPRPEERIRELRLDPDAPLGELFEYHWESGYETLIEGGYHFAGVFHPEDGLCIGNPCKYCGHAIIEP